MNAGERKDPGRQRRADVGAHDDAHRLSELHDAGIDQANQHDGHGRRGLDGNGDAGAQQQALKGVGGHLAKRFFQLSARQLLEPRGHDMHSVEEKGKSANQSDK